MVLAGQLVQILVGMSVYITATLVVKVIAEQAVLITAELTVKLVVPVTAITAVKILVKAFVRQPAKIAAMSAASESAIVTVLATVVIPV